MAMDKEFEEWYQQNERRFHCGHFDEKQIAYSAWIEGRNQALSMSGVSESLLFTRFDLEKAFLAGTNSEDFEEWYQANYR